MTKKQMEERLTQFFPNAKIEVIDLTGGEDHWKVIIESNAFHNKKLLQCHKEVQDAFAGELKTGEVHALTITTKAI